MAPSFSFFDPMHPSANDSARRTRSAWRRGGPSLALGCSSLAAAALGLVADNSSLLWSAGLTAVGSFAFALGIQFLGARRRRAGYSSGRAELVREAIAEDIELSSSPARFRALALAGVGDFQATRRALLAPGDGSVDEDKELELCARIVLESFDGRREEALELCRDLLNLPLRSVGRSLERRQARRAGVVAIARTASSVADEVDYAELARTPTFEPSLFWACRYGAALSCVRRQEPALAHRLVQGAPTWPTESYFHRLQERILAAAKAAVVAAPQVA